ncbi:MULTISPECIES: lipocalin family protein [unclassified Alistipes]|uniref:lipocalin family protein n=1 Tax=unclassified Alistipes TaxID=2608932 RepID=UPI001CD787C7|nr:MULTISPECIES: lipocalin family protein [unclassified Alistipes]
MLILIFISLLIVGVVYGAGTDNVDRRTVRVFDLERYMGDWYEIARYDHRFERGLMEVRATYRLRDDGRVDVLNSGTSLHGERRKSARGKARLTGQPGRLQVSFFWFFYSDYNVMELGDDYDWALVGSRSAKYLWIMSRTPRLPVPTLNRILRLAERRGYKTSGLIFVDQPAEEELAVRGGIRGGAARL